MFDELTDFEKLTLIVSSIALVVTAFSVLVNMLLAVITLMLWFTTKRTVELNGEMLKNLLRQTQHQIDLSYTTSEHKIIESHRQLFLGLIDHPNLLKTFAANINKSPEVVERNILGTLLINHAASIFFYHKQDVIDTKHSDGFVKDAREMFRLPFLVRRWEAVREFHPAEFREFVDETLLTDKEIGA
jgi:hypothetical protein